MNIKKNYMESTAKGRLITQSSWDGGAIQVRDDGNQKSIYENQASDEILDNLDISAASTV